MDVDLAKLGRYIADRCDMGQIEGLCAALGLSADQLVGETRSARAFDLVTLARDRGQLSLLLAALARACPDTFRPAAFSPRVEQAEARRRSYGLWVVLAVGGLAVLMGWGLLRGRPTASPEQVAAAPSYTPTATAVAPTDIPVPSPAPPTATPVLSKETPSPAPATPTPTPTPTLSPTFSPTPTSTATSTPRPTPSLTPTPVLTVVLQGFPALVYDPFGHTLVLPPGDARAGVARLCTPFNAFHGRQAIYVIDSVVQLLGVPLPAQARVTHVSEALPAPIVRTLEVLPHPVTGYKVTGEFADFTGCDLVVAQEVRELLGFPADLGGFSDPPRFEHGWVTIELLPSQ